VNLGFSIADELTLVKLKQPYLLKLTRFPELSTISTQS